MSCCRLQKFRDRKNYREDSEAMQQETMHSVEHLCWRGQCTCSKCGRCNDTREYWKQKSVVIQSGNRTLIARFQENEHPFVISSAHVANLLSSKIPDDNGDVRLAVAAESHNNRFFHLLEPLLRDLQKLQISAFAVCDKRKWFCEPIA